MTVGSDSDSGMHTEPASSCARCEAAIQRGKASGNYLDARDVLVEHQRHALQQLRAQQSPWRVPWDCPRCAHVISPTPVAVNLETGLIEQHCPHCGYFSYGYLLGHGDSGGGPFGPPPAGWPGTIRNS